ncbi:MAG: response regulator transcription factor [Verrucomicrobiales bacterium]|nr:response regulator transcription factor [Verrucomicrobiales bacterium]
MRVLFIEDSKYLQKPVTKALKAAGYGFDATTDGEEGLWMAQSRDYDVIILDIMLPRMSGLEILKTLRGEGNETPILILSSKDSVEDRVHGLELGADDYLVKPFALVELVARVDTLSRRRYNQKSIEITVGDLCLNLATKTVTRDGKEIALQARQYALMEYLMLRKGQVVTRTEIDEHVYDQLDSQDSNVIDVAICSLRKRIEVSPESRPLIHTKRGHGYIMEDRGA